MPKFRKKSVVIEANRWFMNGGHPEDFAHLPHPRGEAYEKGEGQVVRYYRTPEEDGERLCEHCERSMKYHGWIDTLEGGHIVCTGDWIITGVAGERYPCKPDIFDATYEKEE